MAHVANNNTDTTSRPFMDRLTHAVIKETSKNLKYYIDVKRRENAFVLNPNSSVFDPTSLRAKLIYGTTKEHPSLYNSYSADKNILPNYQQSKQIYPTLISPEKQMCREELNFHMRSYNFSPRENSKFSELRLRSTTRSSSACSTNREVRPRSTFKLTRHEQNQLIDDTADILASMVKSRRSIHETHLPIQQIPSIYIPRNINPSPRHIDDQSITQPSIISPTTDLRILSIEQQSKKEKPKTTEDVLTRAAIIMQKSKLITKGLLSEYKISITTGNCNGASTNAPIRIKLYGTNGHTNFHELIHSETHHAPFLKDQTDVFTLQTYHIGELVGITIGHDRKDMRASWFLSKILIDDPIRNITYHIPCNAWLSIKSNDQKTIRDFYVISMVSHKKKISSDEHREENESQSDYSTVITENTATSDATNSSGNDLLIDSKQAKKQRKEQHVSIGPTTIAKKSSSISTNTNHLTQKLSSTTIESHFNRDELTLPTVFAHQIRSPIISTTSSDTDIEGNVTNRTCSTTPTPSPTIHQTRLQSVSEDDTLQTKSTNDIFKRHSINYDRPPARLEKRNSTLSISPERSNKTNEHNVFSFFE